MYFFYRFDQFHMEKKLKCQILDNCTSNLMPVYINSIWDNNNINRKLLPHFPMLLFTFANMDWSVATSVNHLPYHIRVITILLMCTLTIPPLYINILYRGNYPNHLEIAL